jgi:ribosomal protein L7/L12
MNRNTNHEISLSALTAARSGNIIDAIKIVRKETGLDLKQAKELVERALKHGGRSSSPSPRSSMPISALVALQHGQLIEAIRHYREHNKTGLKVAKKAIEDYLAKDPALCQQFKAARTQTSTRVVKRIVWAIVGISLIAAFVYLVTEHRRF